MYDSLHYLFLVNCNDVFYSYIYSSVLTAVQQYWNPNICILWWTNFAIDLRGVFYFLTFYIMGNVSCSN